MIDAAFNEVRSYTKIVFVFADINFVSSMLQNIFIMSKDFSNFEYGKYKSKQS